MLLSLTNCLLKMYNMKQTLNCRIFIVLAVLLFCPASFYAQEPYAVLSNDNKTLTFYYDENKSANNGMDIGPFNSESQRGWNEHCKSITSVVFDSSFNNYTSLISTSYWFTHCEELTSITGIKNLHTDNVRSMTSMFFCCYNIEGIDVSGFKTENVTEMGGLFERCRKLKSIDVSGFKTDNVGNMGGMFAECYELESIDVSGFNTEKVYWMQGMFEECKKLTSLDLTHFDTRNVNGMAWMFYGCAKLTTLDLSSFNTSRLSRTHEMFQGCTELRTIYVGNKWTVENVDKEYSYNEFKDCVSLVGGNGTRYDASQTGISYAHIDVMSNPGYLTYKGQPTKVAAKDCSREYGENNPTFEYDVTGDDLVGTPEITCSATETSPVGTYTIVVSKGTVTNHDVTFNDGILTVTKAPLTVQARSYTILQGDALPQFELDYSGFKNGETQTVLTSQPKVTTSATSTSTPGSYDIEISGAEAQNYAIEYIKGTLKIVASTAEKEAYAALSSDGKTLTFYYDYSKELRSGMDLGSFSSDKPAGWHSARGTLTKVVFDDSFDSYTALTSTAWWFWECENLVSIEGIRNLHTDNVRAMDRMFFRCYKLENLDVSGFNTENVIEIGSMFEHCEKLKNIDVSRFNTSKIGNLGGLFAYCYELESVDLSGFNTESAYYMYGMFHECRKLKSLDLSSFDTRNVNGMGKMFEGCSELTTIYAGINWKTERAKNGDGGDRMFNGCTKLVGGNGTVYDASQTSISYAHVDGGSTNPGYLTYKGNTSVTAKDYYRVYGDANPAFEYDVVGGELMGTPEITCSATPSSPVGKYSIVVSKGSVTNSNVIFNDGTLTVTKAPLTINAKSYTVMRGGTIPELEVEYSGLKNNETEEVLIKKPVVTTIATSDIEPGEYEITVGNAEAQNYEIRYVSGKLIIIPATETKDNVTYELVGDKAIATRAENASGELKIKESVTINEKTYSVTAIGASAFKGCTGLTSVEIPATVKIIGNGAFDGCSSLRVIRIGKGIEEIGSKAFANIAKSNVRTRNDEDALKVYCEAEVLPSTSADAFENSPIGNATLYVTDELISAYKVVIPWNGFGSIVGLSTGIWSVTIDTGNSQIYDLQGNKHGNAKKGIVIIRTMDGKTKKAIVK